jgi:hypothetical protein
MVSFKEKYFHLFHNLKKYKIIDLCTVCESVRLPDLLILVRVRVYMYLAC